MDKSRFVDSAGKQLGHPDRVVTPENVAVKRHVPRF